MITARTVSAAATSSFTRLTLSNSYAAVARCSVVPIILMSSAFVLLGSGKRQGRSQLHDAASYRFSRLKPLPFGHQDLAIS
jgi:hypothetical protein